jgi:uncharacterized protein
MVKHSAKSIFGIILPVLIFASCSPNTQTGAFGLSTTTLTLHGTPLNVEVADTPQSLATGLMFRNSMAEDHGMLFMLGSAEQASFWMKNTKIPLSIAYIDGKGIVREEHDMQPFDERTTRSSGDDIVYALEVNQGWFQRHHIDPGEKVEGIPR